MDNKINSNDHIIDFREFLYKVINNWYYFLLSILLALIVAFGYTRYSNEMYEISTKVLINQKDNGSSASDMLYQSLGKSNSLSIENEQSLFQSYPLILLTISDLRFDISYFIIGDIKTSETFEAPIQVVADLSVTQGLKGSSFKVFVIDENTYRIEDDVIGINTKQYFGEKLKIRNHEFVINKNENFKIYNNSFPNTLVSFRNLKNVAKSYQSRIEISNLEKESTIFQISILEQDQEKGIVFLNKLTENYIKNEVDKKKVSSLNTVTFIENEIKEMEDSLLLIELQLQEYKNIHKIPDLNLKTQSIYNKLTVLESELASFKYLDRYYTYIHDYIEDGQNLDKVIIPSTYGIDNNSLTTLISQMISIQLQKNVLIDGGQVNNPSIEKFNRQINQFTKNIKEVINNSTDANNIIISDLKKRIDLEESAFNDLPIEQRELLNIERIQKISESIYVFLLQKKAEAEIKTSSVVPECQVIEPALYFIKSPVEPNKSQIFTIALLIGALFPLIIFLLLDVINTKVNSKLDLEKLTKIKIIGIVGRNHSGNNLLTKLNPKSSVAEGFRSIRSNLEFQDKNNSNKVYLITSSVSGEGKTFLATNLAIVFANAGNKTLLIGADLRKPKLYREFTLNNKTGLSILLTGKSSLDEVVYQTEIENMDILSSGPLPSNPSDLLVGDEFGNLIEKAKQKYDRIIIDTPPLGLVADSFMIMKYTDVNLYVIRQNFTDKNFLRYVDDLDKNNRIQNLYLILNDVSSGSGVYGYGNYGYGNYGYGYGYGSYVNDSDYFDDNEK